MSDGVLKDDGKSPTTSGGPAGERWGHMTLTLNHETRLIGELREELLKQRSAVSANDTEAVYDGIQSISRILMMLERARTLRREVPGPLAGDDSLPDAEQRSAHEAGLGAVEDARRRLASAAGELAQQLTINHTILKRAAETGEALIKTLFSSLEQTASYTPAAPGKKSSAVFVNKVV